MNGILLIDKPISYTSHDIVDGVRHKLGMRRVGHAGTLDPMATGLLILLVGQATKQSNHMTDFDKCYDGVMTLGCDTETFDAEGRIIQCVEPPPLEDHMIQKVFEQHEGWIDQQVPRYSAVKMQGKKCYERARNEEGFEPPTRRVHVQKMEFLQQVEEDIFFRAQVSKGTYIRSLAYDIGRALGFGMMLSCLRRISVGHYSIREALSYSDFLKMPTFQIESRLRACS